MYVFYRIAKNKEKQKATYSEEQLNIRNKR